MNHNNLQPNIYIAGHKGMAGSAIIRILQDQGQVNIITRARSDLDLTDQAKVRAFFEQGKTGSSLYCCSKSRRHICK